MFRSKKSNWSSVEEFDPTTVGYKYDPGISVVTLVRQLVSEFSSRCPKPESPEEFISSICMDAISYWQIRDEIIEKNLYILSGEFRNGRIIGYPITLWGVAGLGLALQPTLAPVLLRQQIKYFQLTAEGMMEAEEKSEPLRPKSVVKQVIH